MIGWGTDGQQQISKNSITINESLRKTIALEQRAIADGGTLVDRNNTVNSIPYVLLKNRPSLVVTPSAFKEALLYSIVPNNSSLDMDVIRASSQTVINQNNQLVTLGNNVPGITWRNGIPRINIYDQRTNIVERSQDFTNAWWSALNVTRSFDGEFSTLTDTVDGGPVVHAVFRDVTIYTNDGLTSFYEVFIKDVVNVQYITLLTDGTVATLTGANSISATFDVINKVVTETSSFFSAIAYIEDYNGLLRIGFFISGSSSGAGNRRFSVAISPTPTPIANGPNALAYQGNGDKSFKLGYAGLYRNGQNFFETPIVTSGAIATRLRDQVQKWNLTTEINQTEGTLFAEVDLRWLQDPTATAIGRNIFSVNDTGPAAGNNAVSLILTIGAASINRLGVVYRYSSTTTSVIDPTTLTVPGIYKIAATYSSSGGQLYVNGVLVGSTAVNVVNYNDTLTRFNVGNRNTNPVPFQGHIIKTAYFPRVLTAQEIAAL